MLTSDERIRELNRDFLEHDVPTDVLSFPMAESQDFEDPERAVFLGEIYISIETARAQAAERGHPYAREVAHLAVHGLLHLLGMDHATPSERQAMTRAEQRLLQALAPGIAKLGKARR